MRRVGRDAASQRGQGWRSGFPPATTRAAGQGCGEPSDCASGVCVAEQCQPPSCEDGVQNGDESGIDCGGSCEECPVSLPRSCMDLRDTGSSTDGGYVVDPDGPGGEEPRTVYCNMTFSDGGWTRCLLFVNTDMEDQSGNNWLDLCVDSTMADWSGNEILVVLRLPGGAVLYWATGTRTNDWTYEHLTSTSLPGQQDDLNMHENKIVLTNMDGGTDLLVLPGRSSSDYGCAGAMGNGYAVLIYADGATDQRYPKFMAVPYRLQQGDYQGQPRPFGLLGDLWRTVHEIFGDGTAAWDTCGDTLPSFIGYMEIYVR
jgi:Fibrinogen beta and gamma chains, C-terminal globular domain